MNERPSIDALRERVARIEATYRDSVGCRLLDVLHDEAGVLVEPETDLSDIGDSLDAVEFCMAVEREFDVRISDEEWERCVTAKDAIVLVEKKLRQERRA